MTRANQDARPGPEPRNDRLLPLFRTATLVCAITVAWLAFRPTTDATSGLPWDKANHAAAFLVLTVLAGRGWPDLHRRLLTLILLAAGVGVELVQGLPQIGRDADVWDVVADAVGICAGLAAMAWLRRHRPDIRE
ncbi:hypothetical protein [Brevundimonas sp.]|uniref:VanZ family protein n=1 Tax=Brevundimonas sp. TaxID=1871086 RepID=UPI002D3BD452|nr:hypothetical protein [Brevundimonas sp.]HYC73579.1 hypothetical protein [Brevundimonas sp.]